MRVNRVAVVLCALVTFGVVQAPRNPAVEDRINALLAQLTLPEKLSLLGGAPDGFHTVAVPRLGIPALKMADGPMGVRNYGPSTAFPAGIALAATWDPALAERMGATMGSDARARGVNVLLAPAMNIQRVAVNGRNFEYLGEDPYLASQIVAREIRGIQSQDVVATAKHFAANNQEFERNSIDAQVDERTLEELYLPAFHAAVTDGGAWAVMASYNKINGHWATENPPLIAILKQQWNFPGILMSDWGATHGAAAAAAAGLDLEMPSARYMTPEAMQAALASGAVTEAQIDDKVRRLLRAMVVMGFLDHPLGSSGEPLYSGASDQVALQGAQEGIVLLKNGLLKNGSHALPLVRKQIHSIAVFGPNAEPAVYGGGGSAHVVPFRATSLLQGLIDDAQGVRIDYLPFAPQDARSVAAASHFFSAGRAGLSADYFAGDSLTGPPVAQRTETTIAFPRFPPLSGGAVGGGRGGRGGMTEPFAVRWQGAVVPDASGNYVFRIATNRGARLWVGDQLVMDQWSNATPAEFTATVALTVGESKPVKLEYHNSGGGGANLWFGWQPLFTGAAEAKLAAADDAAIVAAGFNAGSEGEGADRSFTLPTGQDALIAAVAKANPRTIVVLNSGGAVDMTHWLGDVSGLIEAWYPGQDGGQALAEILYGEVNPSGRLPATFERAWGDAAADKNYPGADGQVNYAEGLAVGYRYFDRSAVAPQFPFGFGLSYTSFEYTGLQVREHGGAVQVSFRLINTGPRTGAEVAQVYVQPEHPSLPRPLKELKGFVRATLAPSVSQGFVVTLDSSAFSFYNVAAHAWRVDPGMYKILVGASTADIRLSGGIKVP